MVNCTFFPDFSSLLAFDDSDTAAAVYNDWQIILIESARRLLQHSKFLFTSIIVIRVYFLLHYMVELKFF